MGEQLASVLATLAGVYLAVGLLFALPFVLRGAGRIDPQARAGSPGFRAIILPGAVALWPLLLRRWLRGGPPPEERSPHRLLAARRGGDG